MICIRYDHRNVSAQLEPRLRKKITSDKKVLKYVSLKFEETIARFVEGLYCKV